MEKRDLYDENRCLTGKTIFKEQNIPQGYYILVVVSIMQNSKGEFLIQKRSKLKDGKWGLTGGHPKSGETSLQGMLTEIKEEIGLTVKNPILFKEERDEDTFCDLYYIKEDFNINDVVMQEEEVEEVKYATKEQIEDLYNKGLFKKSHYMMFKDCLKYLEEIKYEKK